MTKKYLKCPEESKLENNIKVSKNLTKQVCDNNDECKYATWDEINGVQMYNSKCIHNDMKFSDFNSRKNNLKPIEIQEFNNISSNQPIYNKGYINFNDNDKILDNLVSICNNSLNNYEKCGINQEAGCNLFMQSINAKKAEELKKILNNDTTKYNVELKEKLNNYLIDVKIMLKVILNQVVIRLDVLIQI